MSYTIDILEPVITDPDASLKNLSTAFATLYKKHWEKDMQKKFSGKPFNLNVQALLSGWMSRVMKIFIARDDDSKEIVGFLVGMRYRPMCYESEVFNFIDWYADGYDMEKKLFDFAMNAVKFIGSTEVIIPEELNQRPQGWHEISRDTLIRYERG